MQWVGDAAAYCFPGHERQLKHITIMTPSLSFPEFQKTRVI